MHEDMLTLVTFLVFPLWAMAQEQYLMTFGGYDGMMVNPDLNPYDNRVTLLSLDPNVQIPECLQALNSPSNIYLEGACMAVLLEDQPHVCAGRDAFSAYNDKCYRYDPILDSWTESGTLTVPRLEFSGCAFSPAHGMVLAGGYGIDNAPPSTINTVEYTMHGSIFGKLPDLPQTLQSDCFVALRGGDLLIAGGSDSCQNQNSGCVVSEKTYIYSDYGNMWNRVADMITPRDRLMCATVTTLDGSQEVVAAGGSDVVGVTSDVVEIFSVNTGIWRMANPLPSAIMEATAVPLKDCTEGSFLIVGGISGGKTSDLIYHYDVGSDSWELADAKLPIPVSGVAATMVNSYIFPNCDKE